MQHADQGAAIAEAQGEVIRVQDMLTNSAQARAEYRACIHRRYILHSFPHVIIEKWLPH